MATARAKRPTSRPALGESFSGAAETMPQPDLPIGRRARRDRSSQRRSSGDLYQQPVLRYLFLGRSPMLRLSQLPCVSCQAHSGNEGFNSPSGEPCPKDGLASFAEQR
jgi:hypothetical protein